MIRTGDLFCGNSVFRFESCFLLVRVDPVQFLNTSVYVPKTLAPLLLQK